MNLVRNKKAINYPSCSALEYKDSRLFLIGDDAPELLCLDEMWEEQYHIPLVDYNGYRIPKPEKPDFESAFFWNDKLYLLGSGSKLPQRDKMFIVDVDTRVVERRELSVLYSKLRATADLKELNIEAATICRDKLFLFNRANTSQPNHLIIASPEVLMQANNVDFSIQEIKLCPELNGYGISDVYYDADDDVLFLTASYEKTDNAYDDGEIHGSVLIYLNNAYSNLLSAQIYIDNFTDLNVVDHALFRQKIESVCFYKKTQKGFHLFLSADNDDGCTNLFEVQLER